jgi:hypothetical protein
VNDTSKATTWTTSWPHTVLEVDPVHVVLAETYADGDVDVVHARLGDDVSVRLRARSGPIVRMPTDGVVMIATDDVVLWALGVNREHDQVSSDNSVPALDSVELVRRAQEAVDAAARALSWVGRRAPARPSPP